MISEVRAHRMRCQASQRLLQPRFVVSIILAVQINSIQFNVVVGGDTDGHFLSARASLAYGVHGLPECHATVRNVNESLLADADHIRVLTEPHRVGYVAVVFSPDGLFWLFIFLLEGPVATIFAEDRAHGVCFEKRREFRSCVIF